MSVVSPSPARAILDAAISEKAFQQQIVDYGRLHGWLVAHQYDSRHSEPGYPDLTLVRGERLIFAELKTERGRLSPAQRACLVALYTVAEHALNVSVFLWRPHDWPMIERFLK